MNPRILTWSPEGRVLTANDALLADVPDVVGMETEEVVRALDGFFFWDDPDVDKNDLIYTRVFYPVGEVPETVTPPFVADVPMMMHSINADGQLLTVTDEWLYQLGMSRADVIGRRSTDFLSLESKAYASDVLRDFWTTGYCENVPYNMTRADGTSFQVLLSAKLERLPCGRPRRSLAVLRTTMSVVPHIGKYRLGQPLGEGTMGRIFGATDPLGRELVLKVAFGQASSSPRVAREAAALKEVDHPSIPKFYELLESKGQLVIVMDRVDGVASTLRLSEGTLPRGRALRMVRDIASALATLHKVGIVHRDVKPENVMVERLGSPEHTWLVDLGLALHAERVRLTRARGVVGSPAYAAPEQMAGGDVGPPADVYALGATLYEYTRSELPFGDDGVLERVVRPSPAPRLDYDDELDELVQAMTAVEPSERPSADVVVAWTEKILRAAES